MVGHPNPKDSQYSARKVRTRTYSIYEDQMKYIKKYMGQVNISYLVRAYFDQTVIPDKVHPSIEVEFHKIFATEVPNLRQIPLDEDRATYLFAVVNRAGLTVTAWQCYLYCKNHSSLLR